MQIKLYVPRPALSADERLTLGVSTRGLEPLGACR